MSPPFKVLFGLVCIACAAILVNALFGLGW